MSEAIRALVTFEEALPALKQGRKARRAMWNDESFVERTECGFKCHRGAEWIPSGHDIVATDWQVLAEGK